MDISAAAPAGAGFPTGLHQDGQAEENQLFASSSPKLTPEQASAVAMHAFGVSGTASVLSSERDQNFRITADDMSYVLKVTHPSEDPGVTDFQTKAQLQLMRGGHKVLVPRLVPSLSGDFTHWHDVPGSQLRQAMRLISFLPGVPLFKARGGVAQRRALGEALAHFDIALQGFSHPHAKDKLIWDMQHLADLRPLLVHIDDREKRELASRALTTFETSTSPRSAALRRQVIHNDLNAYNVMVDESNPDKVTAILDFGDMVEAPLVNDLAVACAYQLSDTGNPMSTALDCVSAYHEVKPLNEEEFHLLPELVVARLLVTVLITEWRAKQHPENRTYILRNNPLSWAGLQRFAQTSAQEIENSVFESIRAATESSYE